MAGRSSGSSRTPPAIMRWYRDFQASAPEEFYVFLGLQTVPPGDPFPKEHWGKKIVRAPRLAITGQRPRRDRPSTRCAPSCRSRSSTGAARCPIRPCRRCSTRFYPKGLQWYWKGDFVKALPDDAIDAHIEHAAKVPSAISAMHLYPIDGAVHRAEQMTTPRGTAAMPPGRWSSSGIDPDPAKAPAPQEMGEGLLGGGPSARSRAAPIRTS